MIFRTPRIKQRIHAIQISQQFRCGLCLRRRHKNFAIRFRGLPGVAQFRICIRTSFSFSGSPPERTFSALSPPSLLAHLKPPDALSRIPVPRKNHPRSPVATSPKLFPPHFSSRPYDSFFRIAFGASPKISSSLARVAETAGAIAFGAIRRSPGINECELWGPCDPHLECL